MRKAIRFLGCLIIFFALVIDVLSAAMDNASYGKIISTVEAEVKAKTLQSGTLDLYDEDINKVRNLRMTKAYKEVTQRGDRYYVLFDCRDVQMGDIVQIEGQVFGEDSSYEVEKFNIKNVQALVNDQTQANKEFTDEEIQAAMRQYFDQQRQFTDGKVMLFDQTNNQMRYLELRELNPEVRRMGIFYNSRAKFVDVNTGDILAVDIAVENKKGRLNVQALRIRDIFKAGQ